METRSERQLEIIQAAGKILTSSGIGGLTIKNLAQEMQFSEGAIYRHFTGKEEIIVAMLEFLAENMEERHARVVDAGLSPEENFAALFGDQFDFFENNPHFVVAVFSDGLLEESERINATILRIMQTKMRHVLPILEAGRQQGIFTDRIPTDHLLQVVMGTFRLQMLKWRLANFKLDLKQQGNDMIQSLLKLIKVTR